LFPILKCYLTRLLNALENTSQICILKYCSFICVLSRSLWHWKQNEGEIILTEVSSFGWTTSLFTSWSVKVLYFCLWEPSFDLDLQWTLFLYQPLISWLSDASSYEARRWRKKTGENEKLLIQEIVHQLVKSRLTVLVV